MARNNVRTVVIGPEVWKRAEALAARRGTSVSEVLRAGVASLESTYTEAAAPPVRTGVAPVPEGACTPPVRTEEVWEKMYREDQERRAAQREAAKQRGDVDKMVPLHTQEGRFGE